MGLGLSGLRLGLGQRGGGSRGPTITTAPVISGDPSVEANTLTLTTAPVWDGAVSSSYVWQLNNGGWADIALSTDSTTVTVQAGEHIYDYRVVASATNADGTSTSISNVLEGLDAPVLSNFTDNLDQDPPNALFDSTEAGTLTWDFDASATPPAKGAGSIGTGTDSVTSGANNINIDLSAYPSETGYLHLRVSNAAGDSNVLTSQQITVPGYGANEFVNPGFDADSNWRKVGSVVISGGVATITASGGGVEKRLGVTDFTPTGGTTYEFSVDVTRNVAGGSELAIRLYGDVGGNNYLTSIDVSGGVTGTFTRTGTLPAFSTLALINILGNGGTPDLDIDNFTCREVL